MYKILRSIVERISRGCVLKRRLPARFGHTPLYVSPDAQLKYLKLGETAFDSRLLKVVDEHIAEDSMVWDIGANVGVFSFACASRVTKGRVLAIEADLWLVQLIKKSLKIPKNRYLNFQVLPVAISDHNGVASFMISRRGRASNFLGSIKGRSETGGVREMNLIPTLTLDSLLNDFFHPTFVKIDVEGAESLVLNGSYQLLSTVRPLIYIEVGNESNQHITETLKRYEYNLFDGDDLANRTKRDTCAFNTLAVPR